MHRISPRPDIGIAIAKHQGSYNYVIQHLTSSITEQDLYLTVNPMQNISSIVSDSSIDGVGPIAQSTPHTSFVESTDPVVVLETTRRRTLTRERILGSTTPPVTHVARGRYTPVVWSPTSAVGRLVIDEGSSTEPSVNATVVVRGTSHEDLNISWLEEQQTRLDQPPPGSNQ